MSEASVVLRVDSRDAERSFDRFVQGSERASAAVRPLENGMQARFDSSQAVGGLKNLKSEAQDTYGVLAKIAQASAMLVAGSKSVGFFTSAIKEAASHSEDLAQFEHVFRNVRDEAASMMKTLESDSFGRSSRQAMQLTMGISRQRTRGLESLAAAERRTTLLENLRTNRQATAGSGFGTFSRNASARVLESSARDAAAREAIRASSSSYSSGPSIEYLRSQQTAAFQRHLARNPLDNQYRPQMVSMGMGGMMDASRLASTQGDLRSGLASAGRYAGSGLASAGRWAGGGIREKSSARTRRRNACAIAGRDAITTPETTRRRLTAVAALLRAENAAVAEVIET